MGQKAEISILAKKAVFLADYFLPGIGGYPHPLTENHSAQKILLEWVGNWVPPPLSGKNTPSSF